MEDAVAVIGSLIGSVRIAVVIVCVSGGLRLGLIEEVMHPVRRSIKEEKKQRRRTEQVQATDR